MIFTCRPYTGAEAQQMGLANACFADDVFDREVEAFARAVLQNSWFSLRENKRLLSLVYWLQSPAAIAAEFGAGTPHRRPAKSVVFAGEVSEAWRLQPGVSAVSPSGNSHP
jgi:enoyl-CoA hydratase/carnithine racemase